MPHIATDNWTMPATVMVMGLPFVSFVLIMVLTRSMPRLSSWLSIGAVTVSFGCSLFLLSLHRHMQGPIQFTGRWLVSSDVHISFGFLLDPVSLLMLVIVATICLLVQMYSLGYMAGDPGFSRYYAFMSLFAWAMISLTISPTILQLFIFWELVGLSSYLLIGFWYERFSATDAGKKAFVMTRAGDVAFYMGLLLILLHAGNLNIVDINGLRAGEGISHTVITLSAFLIFGGIVGKSAQFPLLTWLPDAMEGPTPVSALLHSATMVAAGVYLFARLFPFFSLSPTAMAFFLAIGTISMLLASSMALVSRDIKQVWAYSTISQLGFMIMGLAAGSYFAGVFHLAAHAGFKALLFLCSGVFIHKYATNDFFELGAAESRRLRIPLICLLVGAGALAGLPPLSGFFSKEAIIGAMAGLSNPVWPALALLGVFLTAYYTFRVIFVILFPGNEKTDPAEHFGHSRFAHDDDSNRWPYQVMVWPLVVLATITATLGFVRSPFETFLLRGISGLGGQTAGDHGVIAFLALVLAGSGVGLAWLEFGRRGCPQVGFMERIPALYRLFSERWYLDHFYRSFVDRVIDRGFAALFHLNDNRVIDGSIDGMGKGTVESGRFLSVLHQGMIQYRLLATFVVVVLLTVYFIF